MSFIGFGVTIQAALLNNHIQQWNLIDEISPYHGPRD